MKKASPDAPKSEQSHSFFDKFRSHPNNAKKPTPVTQGATTNAVRAAPNVPAERAQHNLPTPGGATRAAVPTGNTPAPGGVTRPAVPMAGNETRMPNGNVARTARDGSLRELHSPQNNMSIRYGMNGSRQIRVDQPDGSRVVLASREFRMSKGRGTSGHAPMTTEPTSTTAC